jgi:hypothetical protein
MIAQVDNMFLYVELLKVLYHRPGLEEERQGRCAQLSRRIQLRITLAEMQRKTGFCRTVYVH